MRLRSNNLLARILPKDARIAEPRKGDRILVLSGSRMQGRTGNVKKIEASDAIVDFGGNIEVLRLSNVATII